MMDPELFSTIAGEEWDRVPPKWGKRMDNLVLLIEDEPSAEVRAEEGLGEHETLLGLYHGVPVALRGNSYGVGVTLPDTITLFRLPLMEEARELVEEGKEPDVAAALRSAVRETLWHEIGHYFGLHEREIRIRERRGTNRYEK
jgi:predicted Zn-dependent protease with MMP-like domain